MPLDLSFALSSPSDSVPDLTIIVFIGVGIAIVAMVVSLLVGMYLVRQGRTRRQLEYTILSNAPLVSVNTSVADQVEIDIRVKGVLVKNAHLVVLNMKNRGKASLHAADYVEPLTCEFGTKVLSASFLNTMPSALRKPNDLSAFLTLSSHSLEFPPFPLHPGETIQISVLLEEKGHIKMRGRLDQGSIFEFETRKRVPLGSQGIAVTAALTSAAAVAIVVTAAAIKTNTVLIEVVTVLELLLVLLLIVASVVVSVVEKSGHLRS